MIPIGNQFRIHVTTQWVSLFCIINYFFCYWKWECVTVCSVMKEAATQCNSDTWSLIEVWPKVWITLGNVEFFIHVSAFFWCPVAVMVSLLTIYAQAFFPITCISDATLPPCMTFVYHFGWCLWLDNLFSRTVFRIFNLTFFSHSIHQSKFTNVKQTCNVASNSKYNSTYIFLIIK